MAEQKFVIMEKQDNLREILIFYVESSFGFSPLRAVNITEAVQLLSQPDISLVICGEGENPGDSLALTEYHSHYLSLKPQLFYPISNLSDAATSLISKLNDSFKILTDIPKKDYTMISIESLPYFDGINSDLYIQLPSKRFVKLFKEGDAVTKEDVTKYKNKGVLNLYLKQDCCFWVLKQIENKLVEIKNDSTKTVEVDMESVRELLKIDESVFQKIKVNMGDTKRKLQKIGLVKNSLLKLNLDRKIESFTKERIELISLIGCGLAKELSWGSEESLEKIVLAANLHDILLWNNPLLAMLRTRYELENIQNKLSDEEIILFKNHPVLTAEALVKLPDIPSEVIYIIKQHHEMPDGSGFPDKLNSNRLRPYSCLFIITLDLATYILTNKEWSIEQFIIDRESFYKGAQFNKLLSLIKTLKTPKSPKNLKAS